MRHITGLAKIPATVEFVCDHLSETGRKIVIFVHHKDVGEILYRQFKQKYHPNNYTTIKYEDRVKVMKLVATMKAEERFVVQEEFNKTERVILIASTLAAGEGLNLQSCCDCVLHERQWNPANEEQAEGRFIRIGQKSTSVTGTYTTASGTVDEFLNEIIERKRVNFHNAMNEGEAPIWVQNDVVNELAEKIVKEANKLQKMAAFR